MKLAVIGSRDWTNYKMMLEKIEFISPTEIVSGGARGADKLAERAGTELGIPVKVFPADWEKHGKSAGYIRNHEIVDYADEGIAFWDGKSKGTAHAIEQFKKQGKRIVIVSKEGWNG